MTLENRQIVLIMTDTQRHDMLGCYRQTGLQTPFLDKLAAGGRRFDKAYTTQPVCQAARTALFTGQYPHEVNGWTNSSGLADNVHTIGERLQRHGIHTAYIGKWHLDGGDYFGLGRCPKGWDPDYWFDMRCYLDRMSPEDRLLSRQAEAMKTRDFPASFTYAHQCSDKAVRFLEANGQDDFFLVVSYDEPHGPSLSPPPFSRMYDDYVFPRSPNLDDPLDNKPEHQRVWAGDRLNQDTSALEVRAPAFFGCHSFVDQEIGRVAAAVRQHAPDALIVYTSDHGDFLHSHRLSGKGPAAYEEITHIPLIMNGPGVEPGSVDRSPVSHIDLPPTLFAIMGLPVPRIFSGRNLLSRLTGQAGPADDPVFIEFGRYEVDHDGFGGFQPLRAAFDGRYKLVVNLLTSDELYDLDLDPHELDNRIEDAQLALVRDRLHDAILAFMNRTRDPFRGYYWEIRPWRKDAVKPTWSYTHMTRQREDEDFEPRQLDYDTGLPMVEATRSKALY